MQYIHLWLACFVPALTHAAVPIIRISLDDPPRARWRPAAQHFKEWFRQNWEILVKAATHHHDWWSQEQLVELRRNANISKELMEEIRGYAEAIEHPQATVEMLTDLMMVYEFGLSEGFGCTGLLVPGVNGTVTHGRNMDVHEDNLWLKDTLFTLVFVQHGKEIAHAMTFGGWLGIHTGMRLDGSFSISLNTRFDPKGQSRPSFAAKGHAKVASKVTMEWTSATLAASRAGGSLTTLTLRKVLLEQATFADAVEAIASTPFMAPAYIILGGASESQGAVITVGRAEKLGVPGFLDVSVMSEVSGQWFIAQMNDDSWRKPTDPRRHKASGIIESLDRKVAPSEYCVMEVLRTYPICFESTLFSWVGTPAYGTEKLLVGNCNRS